MRGILGKLIICTLVLAMILAFTACGSKNKPEDAVIGLVDALKNMDMEKTEEYINSGSLTSVNVEDLPDGDMVIEAAFTNLSLEIVDVQKEGDSAVVKSKISTLDLEAVMGQCTTMVMQELFTGKITEEQSDGRVEELFKETISKEGLPQNTTEVDVSVKRTDGKWRVISDDNFQNAISGGFLGAVANAKGSMSVAD